MKKLKYMPFAKTEREVEIAAYLEDGVSSHREISRQSGIPRRSVDYAAKNLYARIEEQNKGADGPRILLLDVENAPMQAYIWSMWQQGVALNAVKAPTYLLCWAAKWLGEEEVYCDSLHLYGEEAARSENDSLILPGIWRLMDKADIVVGHNGDKFDIKKLNAAFTRAGLTAPSPYRTVDTLKIAKREFKFDSNKLDHLAGELLGKHKLDTGGMELWVQCMQGDMEAWEKMLEYNKEDVRLLEELYLAVRHWDRSHPNVGIMIDTLSRCAVCGSTDLLPTGRYQHTNTSKFEVLRCTQCSATSRRRFSEHKNPNTLVKAR